jgi:hypothetical protein
MYLQKVKSRKLFFLNQFFVGISNVMTKIAGFGSGAESGSGSGSIIQGYGSGDPDPDPHQNVMDPQH